MNNFRVSIRFATPFPALLIGGSKRTLVIADLHIGWETELSRKGIYIPTQTAKLLEEAEKAIEAFKPQKLVILGDLKHTIVGVEAEEWKEIPHFLETLNSMVKEVIVVPGNHDGGLSTLLPENIRLESSDGIAINGVALLHGHTWPNPKLLEYEVMVIGHVHPVVSFREFGFRFVQRVWFIASCESSILARRILRNLGVNRKEEPEEILRDMFGIKLKVKKIIVLPSFNGFLGGQPVNVSNWGGEELIGPIMRCGCIDFVNAEVYMIDGTFLGNIMQLRSLSSV